VLGSSQACASEKSEVEVTSGEQIQRATSNSTASGQEKTTKETLRVGGRQESVLTLLCLEVPKFMLGFFG